MIGACNTGIDGRVVLFGDGADRGDGARVRDGAISGRAIRSESGRGPDRVHSAQGVVRGRVRRCIETLYFEFESLCGRDGIGLRGQRGRKGTAVEGEGGEWSGISERVWVRSVPSKRVRCVEVGRVRDDGMFDGVECLFNDGVDVGLHLLG